MADFHEILGLCKSADQEEIKKAYRKLALQFHPDRNPGDKESAEKFIEINNAYATLSFFENSAGYCHAYRIQDAFQKGRQECTDAVTGSEGASDVAPVSGFPAARILPYSESAVEKHKILAAPFSDPDVSERFKLLRAKIVNENRARGNRTFLITSTRNMEGKSFCAINLAITFAREVDHEVLLIDMNVKNPSVLRYLGIGEQPGILDCLHDNVPIADMVICPGVERLRLLPLGGGRLKSGELLRSRKAGLLIQDMKRRHRDLFIIVDGPALTDGADSVIFSEFVDRTLFVVEHGRVKQHQCAAALSHLDRKKILGVVFNKKAA
jgi:non-specific protein-tyrosine kinase